MGTRDELENEEDSKKDEKQANLTLMDLTSSEAESDSDPGSESKEEEKVTLLNTLLNNISIYMLSFSKAPRSIVEEVIKIQRTFCGIMVMLRGSFVGYGDGMVNFLGGDPSRNLKNISLWWMYARAVCNLNIDGKI
ncbi:hypothetical protein KIW84_064252 [Lathyrus oleraceus]|uniref:Uncharacterized protein n=1 Tax=Pisum sativum TaxID=3888 RepID=A0A9D5A7Y1_PEA|nr:hypothetical protein KIW84_064252 [Pisum sativum]